MTIKEFIERAVEGGWDTELLENDPVRIEGNDLIVHRGENDDRKYCSVFEALLDPNAWRAVGKVMGWRDETYTGEVPPAELPYRLPGWHARMHHMIDALCEGKDITQFLSEIK